jgi:hypothetical protein
MSHFTASPGKIPRLVQHCGAAGLAFVLVSGTTLAADSGGAVPDFSSRDTGWVATSNDLIPPASGPGPVGSDPAHPYVPNNRGIQPTYRVANTNSPILKPWAAEAMRKSNAAVLAGGTGYTARQSCRPSGVPDFEFVIVEPIYFIQTPKEVLITFAGDAQTRHVYLNVQHSKNPKPSWYGESVGHYEGDTLVVDTIGLNTKTFVDNYRTPHSEKLHVIERFHMVEGGKGLEVDLRVEDPDTFNTPWTASQHYRRVKEPYQEQACAENNNMALFDYHIPIADRPDF